MAASSLGAPSFKLSSLNLGSVRPKSSTLQILHCVRSQKSIQFDGFGLVVSLRSKKALTVCKCSASEAETTTNSEDSTEEAKDSGAVSKLIPMFEVESLLKEICDTTSIAEVELKLGGFRLHVTRDLTGQATASPPPISAPVSISTAVEAPATNGSASSLSLAIPKPVSSSNGVQTIHDKAVDEGLVILQSPRVGFFRRSRTIKGKRAPPSCKEKQQVKEGQVLCYIEQLGGEIPVESDISGEVIKILQEDGDPVGYGDALITILPSFPGIKKFQ